MTALLLPTNAFHPPISISNTNSTDAPKYMYTYLHIHPNLHPHSWVLNMTSHPHIKKASWNKIYYHESRGTVHLSLISSSHANQQIDTSKSSGRAIWFPTSPSTPETIPRHCSTYHRMLRTSINQTLSKELEFWFLLWNASLCRDTYMFAWNRTESDDKFKKPVLPPRIS